eukprot:scaffold4105_cov63-Phaeocystis_antarctica.AAC.2
MPRWCSGRGMVRSGRSRKICSSTHPPHCSPVPWRGSGWRGCVGLLEDHAGTEQHLERREPILVVDRIVHAVRVGLNHAREVAVDPHLVVHRVGCQDEHGAAATLAAHGAGREVVVIREGRHGAHRLRHHRHAQGAIIRVRARRRSKSRRGAAGTSGAAPQCRLHYGERRDVVMPARRFAPLIHVWWRPWLPPRLRGLKDCGRLASVSVLGNRASAAQGRHLRRRRRALRRWQLWRRRRRGRQRALEPRPHGVSIVVAPLVDACRAAHLEPQIVALLENLRVGHALQRAPAGDAVRIVVDVASEAVARPWSSHTREPAARAHAAALRLDGDLGACRAGRVDVAVARVGLHKRHRRRRRR